MISREALGLAFDLRDYVEPGRVGVGPDTKALIEIWDDRDPETLRPAIDELARERFILVDRIQSGPRPDGPDAYDLRDISGVQVMAPLQVYFDDLERD